MVFEIYYHVKKHPTDGKLFFFIIGYKFEKKKINLMEV